MSSKKLVLRFQYRDEPPVDVAERGDALSDDERDLVVLLLGEHFSRIEPDAHRFDWFDVNSLTPLERRRREWKTESRDPVVMASQIGIALSQPGSFMPDLTPSEKRQVEVRNAANLLIAEICRLFGPQVKGDTIAHYGRGELLEHLRALDLTRPAIPMLALGRAMPVPNLRDSPSTFAPPATKDAECSSAALGAEPTAKENASGTADTHGPVNRLIDCLFEVVLWSEHVLRVWPQLAHWEGQAGSSRAEAHEARTPLPDTVIDYAGLEAHKKARRRGGQSRFVGLFDALDDMEFRVRRWRHAIDAAHLTLPLVAPWTDDQRAPPIERWTAMVTRELGRLGGCIHRIAHGDLPTDLREPARRVFEEQTAAIRGRLDHLKSIPTGTPHVVIEPKSDVLAIPAEAVVRLERAAAALISQTDRMVEAGSVAARPDQSGGVQVTSGAKAGKGPEIATNPVIQPAADETDTDQPPALTTAERLVLVTMARSDAAMLLSATKVHGEMDVTERLSERTITPAIGRLVELGLAERPQGDRSGARLTIPGRRLASKIAD